MSCGPGELALTTHSDTSAGGKDRDSITQSGTLGRCHAQQRGGALDCRDGEVGPRAQSGLSKRGMGWRGDGLILVFSAIRRNRFAGLSTIGSGQGKEPL